MSSNTTAIDFIGKIGNLCHYCGSNKNLQRHHTDYLKPLEIITLCSKCHHKETLKENNGILGWSKINQSSSGIHYEERRR